MSIAGSLSTALTGLAAVSRAADVVSSNVANSMTEGYARRELELSSRSFGGTGSGVVVNGVNRVVSTAVMADRRIADAETGNASTLADFYTRIESLIGASGEDGSLTSMIDEFEGALISAASRPDSEARLTTVLTKAEDVVDKINAIAKDLGTIRTNADAEIGSQVDTLNKSLIRIDELNRAITTEQSSGRDASSLLDQRQALVDAISEIVPVREVVRDNNQIALYTTSGAILLDGSPQTIGFEKSGVVTADMTLASGRLSGLTINGMSINSTDSGLLGGGTLGALLTIRDQAAPDAQTQIDAFARDLISRYEDSAVDPTLVTGAAGLFTDRDTALNTANEVGLASRISINSLVDPDAGGEVWRLRDGIGATTQGVIGNASLLNAMSDALSATNNAASGSFSSIARSSSGLAAEFLTSISSARQTYEDRETYALSRSEALNELQLMDGVDTDHEMQVLMQIEQAYAANARVIQTIDQLMQQILEL
jgi:flagellar hook-associated protein 1 FlgK